MFKCLFGLNCNMVYFKDVVISHGILDGSTVMSVYKCTVCNREKNEEYSR